jgi:N-acetylglucosaminyldiphosphoundecaprenol N-acetyl-beta-D-mannosaminyltransferase
MNVKSLTRLRQFDEIHLLGVKFHKLNACELIEYIVESASLTQKTIVGNVNVRAMNFSCTLPWYRAFLNKAQLVFCDGFGVLLGAKLHGYNVESKHRMTCPDYIESLALACEAQNVSLFLLAAKPGVVDKAISKLRLVAPSLKIDGHHGFFEKSGDENDQVIKKINHFNPGVLYIGFGMPLQEKWILNNMERIDAKVFLPLGACLDFYTNSVYRGPRWMTDLGLEWLSRLVTEPRRLWKRYLLGNITFFYRVLVEYIRKLVSF